MAVHQPSPMLRFRVRIPAWDLDSFDTQDPAISARSPAGAAAAFAVDQVDDHLRGVPGDFVRVDAWVTDLDTRAQTRCRVVLELSCEVDAFDLAEATDPSAVASCDDSGEA